jgi:signal transduction histidine kinase
VLAPYRRAGFGFLLAGIVGGAGVLLVLFFTFRQRARVRELARERDVQRRLLDEMKKIESFRRDFIADVSHEIKTPLAGIIGIVDLLTSPGNLPQESKDSLLPMLKKESERLNRLVQGILALARIERDTQSGALDFHPVDFSETVRDAIDGLSAQMAKKGISVESSLPDSCVVEGDAQLLFSAVTNLLVNAITHSGTRDLVISLSKRDGNVSLIVEDHGVGIAQDQRERVFDRFYRVDRARGTDTGGTGLGLAIVRSIARLHGGDALLDESESPGCRFVFSINPTGARSVV